MSVDKTNRFWNICRAFQPHLLFNSDKNSFNRSFAIRNPARNNLSMGLNVLFNLEKFGFTKNWFRSKKNTFINNKSEIFIPHRAYFYENIINQHKVIVEIRIKRTTAGRPIKPQFLNKTPLNLFQIYLITKHIFKKTAINCAYLRTLKKDAIAQY